MNMPNNMGSMNMGNMGNMTMNNNFAMFPQSGTYVTFICAAGGYIGGKTNAFALSKKTNVTQNEVYLVEFVNNQFSFIHRLSNYYLGGTI
jgi:hypothetical protein